MKLNCIRRCLYTFIKLKLFIFTICLYFGASNTIFSLTKFWKAFCRSSCTASVSCRNLPSDIPAIRVFNLSVGHLTNTTVFITPAKDIMNLWIFFVIIFLNYLYNRHQNIPYKDAINMVFLLQRNQDILL